MRPVTWRNSTALYDIPSCQIRCCAVLLAILACYVLASVAFARRRLTLPGIKWTGHVLYMTISLISGLVKISPGHQSCRGSFLRIKQPSDNSTRQSPQYEPGYV